VEFRFGRPIFINCSYVNLHLILASELLINNLVTGNAGQMARAIRTAASSPPEIVGRLSAASTTNPHRYQYDDLQYAALAFSLNTSPHPQQPGGTASAGSSGVLECHHPVGPGGYFITPSKAHHHIAPCRSTARPLMFNKVGLPLGVQLKRQTLYFFLILRSIFLSASIKLPRHLAGRMLSHHNSADINSST